MKQIMPDLWQAFLYQSGNLSSGANHVKSIAQKNESVLVQGVVCEQKIECSDLEKNLLKVMDLSI